MITNEGKTIPSVAAIAPGNFPFLYPTKVAQLIAIVLKVTLPAIKISFFLQNK